MYRVVPLADGSQYTIQNVDDLKWYFYHAQQNPNAPEVQKAFQGLLMIPGFNSVYNEWKSMQDAYNNHSGNPNDINYTLGAQGLTPDASSEAGINNSISQYNTQQAQDYATWQMFNNINANVEQLRANGLSASSVIQTGGASGNAVAAADTMKGNAASLGQQKKINDYNNKIGLAKSLIGAAGQMASSGIYGAAIGAIRHSAQAAASSAANSGLKALQAMRPELRQQLMIDQAAREQRTGPYGNL